MLFVIYKYEHCFAYWRLYYSLGRSNNYYLEMQKKAKQ